MADNKIELEVGLNTKEAVSDATKLEKELSRKLTSIKLELVSKEELKDAEAVTETLFKRLKALKELRAENEKGARGRTKSGQRAAAKQSAEIAQIEQEIAQVAMRSFRTKMTADNKAGRSLASKATDTNFSDTSANFMQNFKAAADIFNSFNFELEEAKENAQELNEELEKFDNKALKDAEKDLGSYEKQLQRVVDRIEAARVSGSVEPTKSKSVGVGDLYYTEIQAYRLNNLLKQEAELNEKVASATAEVGRIKAGIAAQEERQRQEALAAEAERLRQEEEKARKAAEQADFEAKLSAEAQAQVDLSNINIDEKIQKQQQYNAELAEEVEQAKQGGFILASTLKITQDDSPTFFDRMRDSLKMIWQRIKNIAFRTLLYSTIGKGIRAIVGYVKEVALADDKTKRQVAILKAYLQVIGQILATYVLPIVNFILGLFIKLLGVITSIAELLGGKGIVKSAKMAAKGFQKMGKEAKGTLADFDELHIIGQSGTEDQSVAPDFSAVPDDGGATGKIAEHLQTIFQLLFVIIPLLWSAYEVGKLIQFLIIDWDPPGLFQLMLGGLLLIVGALISIYEYCDAWTNGIDWDNLLGLLIGISAVVGALYIIFGEAAIPIGLIAGGVALIVLAIHDMLKNGPTLQNGITLVIGLVTTVIGLLLSGHQWLALIVGIIGTAIIIAGNFGDEWSNIFQHISDLTSAFGKLFDDVMAGDVEAIIEDLKNVGRNLANLFIDIFEGIVKAGARAINKIIELINLVKFDVPEWVPIIGGKHFGMSIPTISTDFALPRLAQGAVIPPNREFAAVLGDQRSGTNIETPLDTMIQAFTAALDSRGDGNITINFTGDLAALARVLQPEITKETSRRGRAIINGV